MKTVILPKSLVIIEELAFHRCFSLENISFPDNLQEIGGLAFSDCNSLRVIILPESIHKVKGNPFHNCSLDAIVIRGENANSIYKGWLHYLNDSVTIYVPSAEIEQYKNGFSGTVLPLELYTSVDAINVSFAQENALFDLSGRRLEQKPQKGIYIQGKKKIINK